MPAAEAVRPDAALVDVTIPDGDGVALACQIRRQLHLRHPHLLGREIAGVRTRRPRACRRDSGGRTEPDRCRAPRGQLANPGACEHSRAGRGSRNATAPELWVVLSRLEALGCALAPSRVDGYGDGRFRARYWRRPLSSRRTGEETTTWRPARASE
jgi:hypothetical protein